MQNLYIFFLLYFNSMFSSISLRAHANSSVWIGVVSSSKSKSNNSSLNKPFLRKGYNISLEEVKIENYLETIELLSDRFVKANHHIVLIDDGYKFKSELVCEVLKATCEYYDVPLLSSSAQSLCPSQKDFKISVSAHSSLFFHMGMRWLLVLHCGAARDHQIIDAFKRSGKIKVDYDLDVCKNLSFSTPDSTLPTLTTPSSILKYICAQAERRVVYLTNYVEAYEAVFKDWNPVENGACVFVLEENDGFNIDKPLKYIHMSDGGDDNDGDTTGNGDNDAGGDTTGDGDGDDDGMLKFKANKEIIFEKQVKRTLKRFLELLKMHNLTKKRLSKRLKRWFSKHYTPSYYYQVAEFNGGKVVKRGVVTRQRSRVQVEWHDVVEKVGNESLMELNTSQQNPLPHLKVLATVDSLLLHRSIHFMPERGGGGANEKEGEESYGENGRREKEGRGDNDIEGGCAVDQVPCVDYEKGHVYCCHGYVQDLLQHLSSQLKFSYTLLTIHPGNNHIEQDRLKLDSLMGGKVEMVVGVVDVGGAWGGGVDLSTPYLWQDLSIVVKKSEKSFSMASFLQPFRHSLWIMVAVSVHVVALVLYLLDRFSPFGRFKLERSEDTEEDALNLSSAMWFAWGVLLNSGIGEGTPRSFSARVCGLVWAGFAMIIVASYTANLAAFLVRARPSSVEDGADVEWLREAGTLKDSHVLHYFKCRPHLREAYQSMLQKQYKNLSEAVQAVADGELETLVWEWLAVEPHVGCGLRMLQEAVAKVGHCIAVAKDSAWASAVSSAIEDLRHNGVLDGLEGKWVSGRGGCDEASTSTATLQLYNMAGVFVMVGWGMVAAVLLIFVEVAYHKHQEAKIKEIKTAKNVAERWMTNVKVRNNMKDKSTV